VELYAASTLAKLVSDIEKKGFSLDQYAPGKKPIGHLVEKNDSRTPVFSLSQILDAVRAMGRKGLTVQRYKGLGEMNPDQLYETTMNPARRTLLQVVLEHETSTDQIFTTLMGSEVEPRRLFIQENALNVRNLDI